MPLNEMSLEELVTLSERLNALKQAGRDLAAQAYEPTFSLMPGQPVTITLPFSMPEAEVVGKGMMDFIKAAASGEFDHLPKYTPKFGTRMAEAASDYWRKHYDEHTPSPEAAPDLTQSGEAAQPEPAPVPGETPPATGASAGGTLSAASEADADDAAPSRASATVSLATAASDAKGAAEGGGGAVMAAAMPPAAPVPGSASALAPSSFHGLGAPVWTEEEDQRLIDLVVGGVVQLGKTKMAAIADAAQEMGRPHEGVKSRCYGKVKERINAAIFAAATRQAQTEIPEAATVDPGQGDAAGEGGTPPAVQSSLSPEAARQDESPVAEVLAEASEPRGGDAPAPVPEPDAGATTAPVEKSFVADAVTGHLMSLPDKGGWTVDRDLELMELSIEGWQPNEIALQLQVQANLVKPRFDMLTGLYEDANGKKVRRFTREAVFAALQHLAGKAA